MPDQVDGVIAQKRSEELIALAEKLKYKYMENMINTKAKILVESKTEEYVQGYTPNYVMVRVYTKEDLLGKEIEVTLDKVEGDFMIGRI